MSFSIAYFPLTCETKIFTSKSNSEQRTAFAVLEASTKALAGKRCLGMCATGDKEYMNAAHGHGQTRALTSEVENGRGSAQAKPYFSPLFLEYWYVRVDEAVGGIDAVGSSTIRY